ncbi:hypothetical protein C8J56DRAFT_971936 [Mycena floridula]|nr:hypothetical protein C8J56DRAFT_971936 [Mycena floridula]
MGNHDEAEDMLSSNSQFLSASTSSPRRSPSRQSLKPRRSTASLRGGGSSSLAAMADDFSVATGQHSLAHELAAALMPEPSAGSKLLAEEFGIEYDEGAEGIDEEPQTVVSDIPASDELGSTVISPSFQDAPEDAVVPGRQRREQRSEQDAMELLAQDLQSTDKFLAHLRSIDVDGISQQPALERIASEVIRRINDSTKDREGQVRELLEYEREFRKIAGEVGGGDVLGQLDELTQVDDLVDVKPSAEAALEPPVEEEPSHLRSQSQDWEVDPDLQHQDFDEDDEFGAESSSPIKDAFPPAPVVRGPPTPATTIPQLAHLRSFTTSLVSSLTTISEHAQVNGAATTEAGRKIRALKNKLGGWRTDWDSAERSRVKIEKWEAGIVDIDSGIASSGSRRIDGRELVQEHLQAFELALAEAGVRTQAIMAAS